MRVRRSQRLIAVEMREDERGTLSAHWVAAMPRPELPWGDRPVRCMFGRHRIVAVWETAHPRHLFGWWVTRCARCGKALP